MRILFAIASALAIAACSTSTPPPAAEQAPAGPTGTLAGRVQLEGSPPAPQVIRLDGDPKCAAMAAGQERYSETVVVGDGNTLQNVFVYVKDGLPPQAYPIPPEPVVLDQQQCRYVPRVLGVQVGQPLLIRNSDALLHNIRAEGAVNQMFDVGTPVQGMEITRTFATREVMVPVTCNVHAWMDAYIGVLEHPFFSVTGADGRFSIPNLPPGTYTVETWHEQYGTQTHQVTIDADGTRELAVSYQAS